MGDAILEAIGSAMTYTLIGGLPLALIVKAVRKKARLPWWPFVLFAILGFAASILMLIARSTANPAA